MHPSSHTNETATPSNHSYPNSSPLPPLRRLTSQSVRRTGCQPPCGILKAIRYRCFQADSPCLTIPWRQTQRLHSVLLTATSVLGACNTVFLSHVHLTSPHLTMLREAVRKPQYPIIPRSSPIVSEIRIPGPQPRVRSIQALFR